MLTIDAQLEGLRTMLLEDVSGTWMINAISFTTAK